MATRMQQRRGTAEQWTSANPVLAAGEIGFETDTNQFKMGDGTTTWANLSYFKNLEDLGGSLDDYILLTEKGAVNGVATLDSAAQVPITQLSNLIQSAPQTLDTLNEIAAAISDSNGIVNTAIEAAVSQEILDRNAAISASRTEIQTDISTAINTRFGTTTTTDIPEGNNLYFTTERAQDAVASLIVGSSGIVASYDDAANTLSISADSTLATDTEVATAVSNHNSATTNVHGISNTANLVYTNDSRLSDTRTPSDGSVTAAKIVDGVITSAKIADGTIVAGDIADGAITSAKLLDGTIVDGDINASAAIAQSKISGLTSALDAKAPLADPTFTGTVNAAAVTISGNLTVSGTTTTVSATNLEVTDPLIYIGTGNSANLSDLGLVGHFNNGTYQHTGLVRDHADGKWKLFSGVTTEPGSSTIDLTSATYDTLKTGPVEATNITASGTITASSSGIVFTDGTQVKQGVPSITSINQQTGAYTPVLTDRDKLIEVNSASGVTVTIPTNASVAYPVGTSFDILQTGAGQITIAGAAGVTVNATPGLKLRTQWSSATLMKRATDTWVVYGDLSA